MFYPSFITNKTKHFGFKSGRVIRVVKLVHSVALIIMANFVPLLKSFIANVLECKACLKTNFKCMYVIMCSLVLA